MGRHDEVQSLWKTAKHSHIKLNIHLQNNLPILALDIYPREMKTYVQTKACTQMFIVDLIIIVKTLKQPNELQLVNE